jgi:hypothetical protein
MRKFLLLLTLTFVYTSLFAQSDKEKKAYADEAATLQKQIWDNQPPEFKSTNVPADLSKESAVILARSFSLSRASNGKFKFARALTFTTRTKKFSIFHERVKINDKTALEAFSTLEYQKILNKSTSSGFAKFLDVNNTYVGAKVVKAGGKEIVVNTSEEVLTKNESKDKQGKLAIPDLQVGDVLDYYVCQEDINEKDQGNSYKDNDNILVLADEYPVLYYGIDFQFNKKINTKAIYANGAQHFEETTNEDGDKLLSLKLHNIPKYQGALWTSALREYPYIELGSAYNDEVDKVISKNKYDGPRQMLDARKFNFEGPFAEVIYIVSDDVSALEKYFGGKKNFQKAPLDSTMKVLYTQWKQNTFYQNNYYTYEQGSRYKANDDISELNYNHALSQRAIQFMSMTLYNLKIDHDILLVSSRSTNSLDNVFNDSDFDVLIRINGDKPMYMCFDDPFTHFNEIPERFQGEKVIVLHPVHKNGHNYTFSESEDKLPVISSDQNYINEQLNVSLQPNMQKLKIERTVREGGALRHDDQRSLLAVQDVDDGYSTMLGMTTINQRCLAKVWLQVKAELDKDREKVGKNFAIEIKDKFEQEPQEVANCKVTRMALETNPTFEYKGDFVLDNMVKKAGNNYIIDAGKLTGGFLKLDEKDKTRSKDVYMPCARSFKYTIVINIPQGYAAKGMDEMTQSKSNKTGSFVSSATVSDNKLTIVVSRAYNSNFEKAADWPLMVDLITMASDFNAKKILLEKQN